MVTDHQVKCLFRHYEQTRNIEISAMRSGMNRKTASKYIRKRQLPSNIPFVRDWRTREDPLDFIWEKALVFLKDTPELEAKSLFEHLLEQHPDQINQDSEKFRWVPTAKRVDPKKEVKNHDCVMVILSCMYLILKGKKLVAGIGFEPMTFGL